MLYTFERLINTEKFYKKYIIFQFNVGISIVNPIPFQKYMLDNVYLHICAFEHYRC
jgi:hypothetical protein